MQTPVNFSLGQRGTVSLAPMHRDLSPQAMDRGIHDATLAADTLNWLQPDDTVFIEPVLNSGKLYPSTTSPLAIASMLHQGMEHSKRPDIWRDRTLRRAFELMGVVPAIRLQLTQPSLSPQRLVELANLVALPAATRAA